MAFRTIDFATQRSSFPDKCVTGGEGLEDLCLSPEIRGDNYARHLNRALGLKDLDLQTYNVSTRLYNKKTGKNEEGELPIWPPTEIFSSIAEKDWGKQLHV